MEIKMKPIGYIRTNYIDDSEIPRQSINNMTEKGTIEILDEFKDGIKDIEIGSYAIVLFYFHKAEHPHLISEKRDNKGVYSTRSPRRPNGIGMSIVKIINAENSTLEFLGVDMIDGSPVLDIKPYFDFSPTI
ncbi:MAG: tRNA (N6-threonylcarbamoyladenosine(37)-N6)-methyltransferase TrmO [Sedimentibacter sp.]|nr:tRNA (N6-threonylcarbamoyladenosine(37)-N6)-methyltransferase TrmO [Sedimentibacter sp.]